MQPLTRRPTKTAHISSLQDQEVHAVALSYTIETTIAALERERESRELILPVLVFASQQTPKRQKVCRGILYSSVGPFKRTDMSARERAML